MKTRQENPATPASLLSMAVSAIVLSSSGLAAAAALEEVVVTAQKRSESLQDVPVTLQAFSNEALTDFGITNTQDLQNITPGLVINNTGTQGQIYLRGVGTRFAFSGIEPSVATYIDDRYVSRPSSSIFEFADVERIEVLKGPQGILYGRNATGGAIRVVTLDVVDELEGSVTGTYGNYDQMGLSGTVNVPITDDFGMRLSTLIKKRDGYVDNLDKRGHSDYNDEDSQSYRAKLRWDITDAVTSRLTVDYSNVNDYNGLAVTNVSPPGLNIGEALGGFSGNDSDNMASAINNPTDTDEYSAQLRFDVELENLDFVSVTTYWDYDSDSSVDADGTSLIGQDVTHIYQKSHSYSQEFQLISDTDSDWSWILGAYYLDETNEQFELVADLQDLRGFAISLGNQGTDVTAYAAFGQLSYNFNEQWALTVGARYSYEEKKVEVSKPSPLALVSTAPWPYKDDADWDEVTPKVSLEYSFDYGMAYLTYSAGFKSGGYNYAASIQLPGIGTTPVLEPEKLDMYELGWKTELFDDTLRLNGAIYYYDYTDLQVLRGTTDPTTGTTQTYLENASDASVLGLDLDATWAATDNLTLSGGLNILDTEYKDFQTSAYAYNATLTGDPAAPGMTQIPFDADGEDLLRASDYSAFVSARYEFQAGNARMPLVVTYSYKDDYNYDFVADPLTDNLVQEGYGLLNARLSYIAPSENWSLALWGKNLTDEEYFNDIVPNTVGVRATYGAPLTYGVDVNFTF